MSDWRCAVNKAARRLAHFEERARSRFYPTEEETVITGLLEQTESVCPLLHHVLLIARDK